MQGLSQTQCLFLNRCAVSSFQVSCILTSTYSFKNNEKILHAVCKTKLKAALRHAFSACVCIFEVITLVWLSQLSLNVLFKKLLYKCFAVFFSRLKLKKDWCHWYISRPAMGKKQMLVNVRPKNRSQEMFDPKIEVRLAKFDLTSTPQMMKTAIIALTPVAQVDWWPKNCAKSTIFVQNQQRN